MNKLEVTLKQHTPLIHFQHEQDGATLRGSEVKPKLDRYILEKLGEGELQKGKEIAKRNGWLIGEGDKPALSYKLFIKASGKPLKILTGYQKQGSKHLLKYDTGETKYNKHTREEEPDYEEFPFLLANMGGKEDISKLINLIINNDVKLVITTQYESLLELLDKSISRFFGLYNFGQRSTKGFGSFTVKHIINHKQKKQRDIAPSSIYYPSETPYLSFSLANFENIDQKQYALFKSLDFYWKCLKSGINYTKGMKEEKMKIRYIKSFLWTYLNKRIENPLTWEKRKIKTHFGLLTGSLETLENPNTPTFARALLGLPDKFEYGSGITKKIVTINHNESIEKAINRIPTPIVFKPIISNNDVKVYLLVNEKIKETLNTYENKSFLFSCENSTLSLDIIPDSIDYLQLIRQFHTFFSKNNDMTKSIFHNVKKKGDWNMIPRDIKWENILKEDERIHFKKTIKS